MLHITHFNNCFTADISGPTYLTCVYAQFTSHNLAPHDAGSASFVGIEYRLDAPSSKHRLARSACTRSNDFETFLLCSVFQWWLEFSTEQFLTFSAWILLTRSFSLRKPPPLRIWYSAFLLSLYAINQSPTKRCTTDLFLWWLITAISQLSTRQNWISAYWTNNNFPAYSSLRSELVISPLPSMNTWLSLIKYLPLSNVVIHIITIIVYYATKAA